MKRFHHALRLTATALLAGAVLVFAGNGVLGGPHHWTLAGWTALVRDRGAATAAMTVARYVALAAAGYLAVIGTATMLAIASRVHWLERLLSFATPRLFRSTLGLVTVATFAHPIAAGAVDASSNPPVMVLIDPTTTWRPSPPPTMRRIEAPAAAESPTTTVTFEVSRIVDKPVVDAPVTVTLSQPYGPPAPPSTVDINHPVNATTWTIGRGDHLWHVADATLTRSLGHPPSTREIAIYWRALVDANRDRLVDRDNPDLVFTGQEFVLPSV